MNKRQNNSARASALQISLLLALIVIPAILLTSGFTAAAPKQDGFYPPLQQEAPVVSQQSEFSAQQPTPTPACTPLPPITQGFDDITNIIPAGWFMRDNSQPGPGTVGWFQGDSAIFNAQSGSANSYIAANYNNGTGTSTLSNWLLTPPMTIGPGAGVIFWTRTVDTPIYPDRLQVRMSTNGASANVGTTATDVGDFTTLLLDINPTYSTTGYPNIWTQYTVLATGITTPVRGRFAFRYFVENGGPGGANSDYIGIDSVVVGPGCGGSFATPTPVPSPTPFYSFAIYQDFDRVVPPALPSGWASSFTAGPADCTPTGTCALGTNWVTTTSNPGGGPNSVFHGASACVTDSALDSAGFLVPSGYPYFAGFSHSYNLENGRDGGVLEISINGGRFIDINEAGGNVQYNGAISTDFLSPIAGRPAWTGNSGGYVGASITFPSVALGQGIRLRFRLATDCSGGVSGMGWYIDSLYVLVQNEMPSPTPAPTPASTPTPPPVVCSVAEPFNDVATSFSNGWVKRNNSSPLGITDWFQGIPAVFPAQSGSSNAYVAASFNAGSGTGTISDWLLTPPITLQNGGVFTFWTRTVSTPVYPDRLQVRMSTNGNSSNVGSSATSVGDFGTLLLDINPTYTTSDYPSAWTQYTVVLSGLGLPINGRLAFRYFVENGGSTGNNSDYIGIDTVSYACNAGGQTPTPPPPTATPIPTPSPTPPLPTPTPRPPTQVNISGSIVYCSNPTPPSVPSVTLSLTGSGSGTTLSDGSGNYTFLSLPSGGTYTVTPSKSALVSGSNGIDTVDVLAVQRHFLNILLIPPGCRLMAADVNGDSAITTVDVIAIQRFFLGLSTGLANVGKYQFNPANRTYNPIIGNQTNQNYDALIFGDVASPFVAP